jgi:hypothetical protein
MAKKLLLNLLGGVLFINCCSEGSASVAASVGARKNVFPSNEGQMGKDTSKMKSGQSKSNGKKARKPKKESKALKPSEEALPFLDEDPRSQESQVASQQAEPTPEPQRVVVPVICSERVLEVARSRNCSSSDLWQRMLTLTDKIILENGWFRSQGVEKLVYYLAQRYAASSDEDEKDVITLYFISTSECYSDELFGDDEDAEQRAIDFVNECLAGNNF